MNGDDVAIIGLTMPLPSSDIITKIALPPNVLPLNVTVEMPQVLLLVLLKRMVGVTHCPYKLTRMKMTILAKKNVLIIERQ